MSKLGIKYMLYVFAISTVFGITGILVAYIEPIDYSIIASIVGNGIGYYLLYRFARFVLNINMHKYE